MPIDNELQINTDWKDHIPEGWSGCVISHDGTKAHIHLNIDDEHAPIPVGVAYLLAMLGRYNVDPVWRAELLHWFKPTGIAPGEPLS